MNQEVTQPEAGAPVETAEQNGETGSRASSFDFGRLDRIPKSQLLAMHQLHENFVRSLSSGLSAYLRTQASLTLLSLEQSSYAEFLKAIPPPTCITYLRLHPHDGSAVLALNNSLMFSLIELLLGGSGKTAVKIQRKLTEIEKTLLQTVMRVVVRDLNETWQNVADVRFSLQSLTSEPDVQVMPSGEAVVVIAFEMRVGSNSGIMTLAIPSIFIKRLAYKSDQSRQVRRVAPNVGDQEHLGHLIQNASLVFEARMDGGSIAARRLLELHPGDVLVLDHPLDRKISGQLNGVEKWLGRIVTKGEKLAFEVHGLDDTRRR
jgi:flagellar motor switch protein FliM